MSVSTAPSDPLPSTVSRILPESIDSPATENATLPLFTTSLSGLEPFPVVPTPPGLADRP